MAAPWHGGGVTPGRTSPAGRPPDIPQWVLELLSQIEQQYGQEREGYLERMLGQLEDPGYGDMEPSILERNLQAAWQRAMSTPAISESELAARQRQMYKDLVTGEEAARKGVQSEWSARGMGTGGGVLEDIGSMIASRYLDYGREKQRMRESASDINRRHLLATLGGAGGFVSGAAQRRMGALGGMAGLGGARAGALQQAFASVQPKGMHWLTSEHDPRQPKYGQPSFAPTGGYQYRGGF